MIKIRQGLDLPIEGEPLQTIEPGPTLKSVGLVAEDYIGMRPTMHVSEGDTVRKGQLLFEDKKTPGVKYVAPEGGRVIGVTRGAKRKFLSLSLEVETESSDEVTFTSYQNADLNSLTRENVVENLTNSGMWPSFRTRPFGKVPAVDAVPHSIFVTAIDTRPLAVRPEAIIKEHELDFVYGLQVIQHLTAGKVYVCKSPDANLPGSELGFTSYEDFAGPHPAGLPGTHIHMLDPVSAKKSVWHLGYQDVIAIGKLFVTGRLWTERVISLAGPAVKRPRLLRTTVGAALADLTQDELAEGNVRVVSGSVLSGRQIAESTGFLGRYHLQVSALHEGNQREFLGWQTPGFNKFSATRVFASAFVGAAKKFGLTTSLEGSPRSMVPIGSYEQVLPLDMEPVYLLRALIVKDTETAQQLGALELDEEDVALCTFVCPAKYDYGPLLRENLTIIEKEG